MQKRELNRKKRHFRIRKKIKGTAERPRVSVRRTLNHMHVQLIDDINERTLCGMSTSSKELGIKGSTKNIVAAEALADAFATKIKDCGIDTICFDRGGALYHGRIKAFADKLRSNGIKF